MKTGHFLIILGALASATASGIPRLELSDPQQDRFARLRMPANIIGKDDRENVSKAKNVKLTAEQVQQALACMIKIHCPDYMPSADSASGGAVGVSDQVLTARHVFINENGQIRKGVENCRAYSFMDPKNPIALHLDYEDLKNGGNPYQSNRVEGLMVRLARPLPSCNPFQLDRSGSLMSMGDPLVCISADQQRLPRGVNDKEPIVTPGIVRKVFHTKGNLPSVFHSTCDGAEGDSGGLAMAIAPGGQWFAKGIILGGGTAEKDGWEYDENKGSRTQHVGIDAGLLQMALSRTSNQYPSRQAELDFAPAVQ